MAIRMAPKVKARTAVRVKGLTVLTVLTAMALRAILRGLAATTMGRVRGMVRVSLKSQPRLALQSL
jgi:hypothetical protein